MDHVLAKVKGLRKKPYFKLISDHTLFETIVADPAHGINYSADHNLDEDAWFKIEAFSQQPYCIDVLKGDFDSKDYDDLNRDQFVKIAYLFALQGEDFYFQKLTPSFFIKRKMLTFGETVEVEKSTNRLVVNARPDAVYFKGADTLVFRNLATISSIFTGIDELYKEATNEEVKAFLQESILVLKDEYGIENVSKPNRKRIALAMATLATMSDENRESMPSYIEQYCKQRLNFDTENKSFEISTDEELKLLLYGIEQRYYTTPFGHEKRLANSIVAL